jgi:hypothetical protein
MKGSLDPITAQKIDAFARRRLRLILVRGVCSVLTILLALMSALALLDFFVLMADELRWALSGAAYLAALAAAWFTCARIVVRAPDPRELARLIEQARPELREDLISAVELGEEGPRPAWESEAFREVLQQDVAARMGAVDVAGVLSMARIRRWLLASAGVVGACVVLLLVPGLRFEHLLQRALRPMANLERISRVQVTVLEPRPPEREVPQSDVVVVRIETDGPEVRRAVLETFPAGKKPERVEMTPAGGRRFESSISVGREPVAYRIRAGDAVTRKYALTAVPRPEAVAFHKTFTYPAYAGREPRKLTEATGDLIELEGTVADLEVEVDQEVSKAELRIEQAGKTRVEPLAPGGAPRRLRARVPVNASGTYRVHLESVRAGTVIENKFSPQYEIRSMPDLVPRVSLEEPKQDLLVPPLEVVSVRGSARDDLGLRVVAQAVRVNQGEWTEVPLSENAGTQAAVSRRWDLYELGVHPGDRITTKLVAVDLKGSRAESNPVHIVISAPGFDPQRHVPLVAKKLAYDALVELRDQVRAAGKRVSEAAALAASDELPRRQALLNAAQDSEKLAQKAEETEGRIKEALRLARAGRESADLVLAAILVRRLREESVGGGRSEIEKAGQASEAPAAVALLKRAEASFARATDLAQAAEGGYREILASEEAIAALNDVRDLAREQEAIHRQLQEAVAAKDPKAWERLGRREGVAADQVATVENVLQVLALHGQEGYGKRAAQLAQQLQASREALKKALESAAGPALAGPSAALQNTVNAALQQLHGLEHELARRAERSEDALEKKAEPNAADLTAAVREMEALAKAPAGDEARRQGDRAVGRGKAARAQLEGRAGVEEARRDSDAFFVSDASLAGRALHAVLEAHQAAPEAEKTRDTLRVVEKALRTLETGHRAAELSAALRALAEQERWHGAAANAATRHPKDWRWMEERVRALPEEFKAAGLVVEAARELQKSWQGAAGDAVRREMAERAAFGRRPQGAAPSMERLGGDVGKVLSVIKPMMEDARRELLKLVPSLAERIMLLAQAAERIQEKTSALSDKAPQSEAAQVRPEARQLLDNQQGIDRQIDDVMAELRRDANVQNLFTPEGREKARDADDAVAMLKQSPPKAEDLLRQAAASPETKAQEHALEKAAEQQGKLAEALKTLAKHYENAEKGKPEETRPELRKAEEALGIRKQLDAQYAQMEKLAQLSQQSPEAMKQALAEELQKNEAMQRELAELTQAALQRAGEKLQQAQQAERQVQQQLQSQAQQQGQSQKGLAEQAKKIAEEARQMARQDVPQLAKESPQAAKPLQEAAKNLEEGAAAVPQDFANPPQAAKQLEQAAAELNQAAQDLKGAQQTAQQQAQAAQQAMQKESADAQAAQQKSQQEGAQAQAAQQAQQAAENAEKMAQEAAKAAQAAAQAQPENAAAQQAAQQAAQRAEQAKAQTQQAKAAAQKEAGEAQAAQQAAQAEAAQAQSAQQAAQKAQAAAQRAGEETQQAQALAQKAQALAQQAGQQGQSQQGQMAQAAQAQQQVEKTLESAQGDIQQAARNQESGGMPETAAQLGQVAKGVEGVRRNEVPQAAQAAQGQNPQQAQQAAQRAEQAIQAQAQALAKAAQAAAQAQAAQEGQPGQEGQLSESASEFLAQALNALNAQGQQPGQPQQQPGQQGQPSAAQQAAQSAAQQQQQSMAQQRSQGQQPGQQGQGQGQQPGQMPFSQSPGAGKGAQVQSGPLGEGQLPEGVMLRPGEWGKLPPRLARDLLEAQREGVGGEYRQMVETYFRVVAERAREKK